MRTERYVRDVAPFQTRTASTHVILTAPAPLPHQVTTLKRVFDGQIDKLNAKAFKKHGPSAAPVTDLPLDDFVVVVRQLCKELNVKPLPKKGDLKVRLEIIPKQRSAATSVHIGLPPTLLGNCTKFNITVWSGSA